MNLSLGFSPCPNDTFIFNALVHRKIETRGITFDPQLHDVETLNRKAALTEFDITKISFAAYPNVMNEYILLTSGSALGHHCGPLLISKKTVSPESIPSKTLAIPGRHTTANFLFDIFYPKQSGKQEMNFAQIEDAVLDEVTDLGIIIHENRFTYEKRGLQKVSDLGEQWESLTGHPIPLGGIVIRRTLPSGLQILVNQLIRQSIEYAFAHVEETMDYVRSHAQEMDEHVMKQHIGLYVNNYSIELGETGKAALNCFFEHDPHKQDSKVPQLPRFVQEVPAL